MSTPAKRRAVLDAVLVFGFTVVAVALVHWMLGDLERGLPVWPVEYLAMLGVSLLSLYLLDADPADYGLSWRGIGPQFAATLRCGVPFSAFALLSFVNWPVPPAVASMVFGVAALFLFAYVLGKPSASKALAAPCLLIALNPHAVPSAMAGVAFYLFLLGPAEELFFRGVVQSRLNLAFGRPFEFFGARWGWGAIGAALLFALMHVLNLPALVAGHWQPDWWSGPRTFCLALPFAYLRERTGGVLAPALLHAWPQAIVFAIRTLARA